jgi:uncharacterized protein with HEPN domain
MRRIRDRLEDVLDAIAQIETEKVKGKTAFDASPLIQVWMVHHLMLIGEAVRGLDPALKQKYPATPWREIAGMRNAHLAWHGATVPMRTTRCQGKLRIKVEGYHLLQKREPRRHKTRGGVQNM